ncbi:MAG: hypothetical protein HY925_11685 [Elusimicrobia bacterium]|nr:hypothetical protein [Elusimicrobiota bacterium]
MSSKKEDGMVLTVWAPQEPDPSSPPPDGWYEEAVLAPIRLAAKLAPSLICLCLVQNEDAGLPARALEDALSFLARQRKIPFAVVRAP